MVVNSQGDEAFCEFCHETVKLDNYKPKWNGGNKQSEWKGKLGKAMGSVLLFVLVISPKIYRVWHNYEERRQQQEYERILEKFEEGINRRQQEYSLPITEGESGGQDEGSVTSSRVTDDEGENRLHGYIGMMAEQAFGMPADKIPQEELNRIQWIETKSDIDYFYIGYSFDNPLENETAELTWITFPNHTETGAESLKHFHGLKKLYLYGMVEGEDIEGLELQSVGGLIEDLPGLADSLADPLQLKELYIDAEIESLEGLEQFENLEVLRIDDVYGLELEPLAGMSGLKVLTLKSYEPGYDVSVLYALTELEELYLDMYGLKNVDFVTQMKQLRQLELKNADIPDVEELAGMEQLESLTIGGCESLRDVATIGQLTGLKELAIEIPYDCRTPDLSSLSELKKLELNGFNDCSFLSGMTSLTSLTMNYCELGGSVDFSGLTSLQELSCKSYFTGVAQPVAYIAQFPALRRLELRGVATYDDISGIFNMPYLEELDISGMQCEIAFDRITDNPSLEVLKMNGLCLYENVQTGGEDGFMWADWDDVILDEHTDFLSHFGGLKELHMANNKLTDISFVYALSNLEVLDISGNYISDLEPLAENVFLREVYCAENPLVGDVSLGSQILVDTEGGDWLEDMEEYGW